MAPHDPLTDSSCSERLSWQRNNRSDDYGPDPTEDKYESPQAWTNPYQRRPSRVKNKTPLHVRAAVRHRKNKAAKVHRKAIRIALATKRNREG
jgi:hypothetical protein